MRISDGAWTRRERYGALAPVTRPRSPGILHHEGHILRCAESSVMRQRSQHVGAGLAERRLNNPLAVRRCRRHFPTRRPWRAPALPVVFPDNDLLWIEGDLACASVHEPGQSQTDGDVGGTGAPSLAF